MTHEGWLLDRAVAMLKVLLAERERFARGLVHIPPEGATLVEIERAALVAALDRTNWVQKRAAEFLGTTARVMNYKMAKHRLYQDHPNGVTRRHYQAPRATAPRRHTPRQRAGHGGRTRGRS